MDDFVTPIPVRLSLSGGRFIDIRRRLNHGETEDMYARMSPDGASINRREIRTAKVLAYVLGWSLLKEGVPVPIAPELPEQTRLDTLRNLDPDRFVEMHQAIEAHEEAMAHERVAEKNAQAGATGSSAISPSPSVVTGAMSGSENSTETSTPFSSTN